MISDIAQPSSNTQSECIPFHKYHSLENDFIVIDQPRPFGLLEGITKRLCNRHCGIGADGILFLQRKTNTAFHMFIQNADGRNGQFSGNGLRCLAQYIHQTYGLQEITFPQFDITCHMNEAFVHTTVPIKKATFDSERIIILNEKQAVKGYFVTTQNPHFIIINPPIPDSVLKNEAISNEHILTVKKIAPDHNISWVQIGHAGIKIRTFERGVGFTKACSSAILATIELLTYQNLIGAGNHSIITQGGPCDILIADTMNEVTLQASAHHIFSGTVKLLL